MRLRLDPIVPFEGWQVAYADTIKRIVPRVTPERMTIGTLRFEKGFYDMRNTIFSTGPELPGYLDKMEPMFEPQVFAGSSKPKVGKYSFSDQERGIFSDLSFMKFGNIRTARLLSARNRLRSGGLWGWTKRIYSACVRCDEVDLTSMSGF